MEKTSSCIDASLGSSAQQKNVDGKIPTLRGSRSIVAKFGREAEGQRGRKTREDRGFKILNVAEGDSPAAPTAPGAKWDRRVRNSNRYGDGDWNAGGGDAVRRR